MITSDYFKRRVLNIFIKDILLRIRINTVSYLYLFWSVESTLRIICLLSDVTAYLVPYRSVLSSVCHVTDGVGTLSTGGNSKITGWPAFTRSFWGGVDLNVDISVMLNKIFITKRTFYKVFKSFCLYFITALRWKKAL